MLDLALARPHRLPRFHRASEPPAFRLTDADLEILRQIATHRFLRSTHVAALVGRSLATVNGRLKGLYHHGYVDRPRAQLDYYPDHESGRMVYALAERGARVLTLHEGADAAPHDWTRRNAIGRPFLEHQLEVVEFLVALKRDIAARSDVRLITPDAIVAALPYATRHARNPLAMLVKITDKGGSREIGLVPDFVFGLQFASGAKHFYMVEIDRGTMPVTRRDLDQTSFARKMRAYIAVHAARTHERQFGWKSFRVLTVTTDQRRRDKMIEELRKLRARQSSGPAPFLFATREQTRSGALACEWLNDRDGSTLIAQK